MRRHFFSGLEYRRGFCVRAALFYAPLCTAEASQAVDDEEDMSTLADKKLLVVDDSMPILRMMSNLMSGKAKAIVTQAKDGRQAYECVESHTADSIGVGRSEKDNHFDVIVMDIQMPNMDGFQATQKIRALEAERGLAPAIIVGISINTQERMMTDAQASGMDAFLAKPFNIHELERVCVDIIASRDDKTGTEGRQLHRLSSSMTIFTRGVSTGADTPIEKYDGLGQLPV